MSEQNNQLLPSLFLYLSFSWRIFHSHSCVRCSTTIAQFDSLLYFFQFFLFLSHLSTLHHRTSLLAIFVGVCMCIVYDVCAMYNKCKKTETCLSLSFSFHVFALMPSKEANSCWTLCNAAGLIKHSEKRKNIDHNCCLGGQLPVSVCVCVQIDIKLVFVIIIFLLIRYWEM